MFEFRKSIPALICAILWGFSFVAVRHLILPITKLTPPYLTPEQLSLGMMITAYLSLWAACQHFEAPKADKREVMLAVAGLMGFGSLMCIGYATQHIGSIKVGLISTALPMILPRLVKQLTDERRTSLNMVLGLILVLAGIATVIIFSGKEARLTTLPIGEMLALAASVMLSIYVTLLQNVTSQYGNMMTMRRSLFYAFVAFAIVINIEIQGDVSKGFSYITEPDLMIPLLYLGIISMVATPVLFTFTKSTNPDKLPDFLLYLLPVVIIASGFGFEHEHLTRDVVVGGGWILAGLVLSRA